MTIIIIYIQPFILSQNKIYLFYYLCFVHKAKLLYTQVKIFLLGPLRLHETLVYRGSDYGDSTVLQTAENLILKTDKKSGHCASFSKAGEIFPSF